MAVAKQKGIVLSADEINRLRDGKPGIIWRTAKIQPPDARQWRISTLVESTARDDRKHIGKLQWVIVEDLNVLERDKRRFTPEVGYAGDEFWVREAFSLIGDPQLGTTSHFIYKADSARALGAYGAARWRSGGEMFLAASRFTLTVQSVVFKRLQDVTEEEARLSGEDAICNCGEGLMQHDGIGGCNYGTAKKTALDGFRESWDAAHKKRNRWDDNGWQWGAVVTMEVAK